jgi:AcrR family transcriptional regulator
MARSDRASTSAPPPAPLSATQRRTVDAALGLFGKQGVSGTSLQMIADAAGVTKASIYYQFPTKEAIVLAAMEEPLARITTAIETAEREADPDRALNAVLPAMVDLAIENRSIARFLQTDPEIARIMAKHTRYRHLMERRDDLLRQGRDTPEARVRAATILAALGTVAAEPVVSGLDDETLRSVFLELAREFLDGCPKATMPTG